MKWISMDLGKKGGIAFWKDNVLKSVMPMPIINNNYDIHSIVNFMEDVEMIVVERINARSGRLAVFSLGYAYGIFKTIAITKNILFIEVLPQVWKRDMQLLKMSKSDVVRKYNKENNTNFKMKHDGLVEAIMIGQWFLKYGFRSKL